MKLASKSKNRLAILEMIQDGILTDEVSSLIESQSEEKVNELIYPNLLEKITDYVMDKKGFSRSLAREKAKTMIKSDESTTSPVKNIQFMGTDNRPFMVIDVGGITVAVEIRKGNRGNSLREGFGQSMIHSTIYDFVLCVFIDTSESQKIKHGSTSITEQYFLDNIWENFNIKFVVV